jgi:1-aminocyclopropane-1-carboxylate deaminase/D-cysteine desulfhydrase-like pyridoxal-dependent ACC family enzyme
MLSLCRLPRCACSRAMSGTACSQVRKLEFLLSEALRLGCNCVITAGGIQSNHARATAVAARCEHAYSCSACNC